jgi:HK97 family phage major capsid protein
VTGDGLIDFALSLPAPYRVGARWLMSSLTVAAVRKLKDGQGNYLWNNDYQADQPASLPGFPVEIDENMPSIASGNTPIAFGDFKRGYLINDRYGIRVLRDPYTQKGWTLYYTTKRMGGGVADPNAVRLLRVSAS